MIRTSEMILAPVHDNKDLWETPDHIFNRLNEKFNFNLDPCATKNTAKCKRYFNKRDNGLIQSWRDAIVFCNPPYSRGNIDIWVIKCYRESYRGAVVVALLPVSTSSDWFQQYCLGNTIYWVDKRIRFKNAPYTAPFSSMIVHFNGINKNLTWKQ